MNMQNVGRQIEELRKSKGMTQSDLGERLGVSFHKIKFTKWGRVKNGKKFAKMNLSPFGK